MLQSIRGMLSDYLWINSVRRHRSRLGRRLAPKYSRYLEGARRSSHVTTTASPEISKLAEQFRSDGWAAFTPAASAQLAKSMWDKIRKQEADGAPLWGADGRYARGDIYKEFPEVDQLFNSELGDFFRAVYGAHFKIFYGVCYKSVYEANGAVGSQLWHADGGPGTCINLMWCLSPVSRENGAMECLPWVETMQLFEREKSIRREISGQGRDALCKFYEREIASSFTTDIVQPTGDSGLLFAFSNNLVHKGGYPKPGNERCVCVFHIYPSAAPTPFDRYRVEGIPKRSGFPQNPAFFDDGSAHG